MGYIRHHAIIVTAWDIVAASDAREKARELFPSGEAIGQVSPILQSPINKFYTFVVGPDGSKEGWSDSDNGDRARHGFIEWLRSQHYDDGSTWLKWAVVQYGDDEGDTHIVAHSDELGDAA